MATWDLYANLPNQHSMVALVRWNGDLIGIGVHTLSSLYTRVAKYDPDTGAWTVLGTISSTTRSSKRAAIIGNTAYWISTDNLFRSVDLTTITDTTLDPPDGYLPESSGLEAIDGLVYTLVPDATTPLQVYDPVEAEWAGLANPPVTLQDPSSVVADGLLYVKGINQSTSGPWFGVYDPSLDTWTTLTPDSVHQARTSGVAGDDGLLYYPGGWDADAGQPTGVTRVYDTNTNTWAAGDPVPGFTTSYTVSAVLPYVVDDVPVMMVRLTPFSGTGELLTYAVGEEPPPEPVQADLTVTLDVEYPITTTDAYLTLTLDVTGGPGVTADLLVTFTTGRATTATTVAQLDVEPLPVPWSPPAPNTPVGATPVVPARTLGADEATITPVMSGADQYELAWRPDGQLAGTVTSFGPSSNPAPEDGFEVEGTPNVSIDWGAEPPSTRTHTYGAPTVELANDQPLPELMPVDALPAGPDVIGGCLQPHGTTLCDGLDPIIRCMALAQLPEILPTRLELVTAAADSVGLQLVVLNGTSGLTAPGGLVSADYRTEGKTLAQVLDDLLTGAGAPVWYAPGIVFVHGGGLPTVTLELPAVRGAGGSSTAQPGAVFEDPEPILAEYLADCRDDTGSPGDPCDGETFETARSGTLTWVETAGAGLSYQEITTTLTKEDGRITREEVTTRRAMWRPGDNITSPFQHSGGGSVVIAPVEWTVREHTYLACCPSALSHSLERTWAVRGVTDPDDTYETAAGAYLSLVKEVTQTWHAEGWLRARLEVTQTHHGWNLGPGLVVSPTYKFASRNETYVPIGRGLWHINTTVRDSILMPVGENTSTPVGTHWGEVINTYTVVTDQAPAQVTCDEPGMDPCTGAPCADVREADFDRDHAEWAAKAAAWDANNPATRVTTTITYTGRHQLQPGAVTPLGLVASVSWSGSGDRTDQPGESTTVEYWGAL